MSSNHSCTELSKTQFFLGFSLKQRKQRLAEHLIQKNDRHKKNHLVSGSQPWREIPPNLTF